MRDRKPPRLSAGEKLLLPLLADIREGRLAASTASARRRLEDLRSILESIIDGEDPIEALGLLDRMEASDCFYRDRNMALRIYSEKKLRGKAWPIVHRNVNAWLESQIDGVDRRFAHQYSKPLKLANMRNIYSEIRSETWRGDTVEPGVHFDIWSECQHMPDLDDLGREYASRRLAEIARELLATLYQGRNKLTAEQLADGAQRAAESHEIWVEDIDVLAIAQECLEAARADSKQ